MIYILLIIIAVLCFTIVYLIANNHDLKKQIQNLQSENAAPDLQSKPAVASNNFPTAEPTPDTEPTPEPAIKENPFEQLSDAEIHQAKKFEQISLYDDDVHNTTNNIPKGYGIDENGLPYKQNRVDGFGWGKEFNVFIVKNDPFFHVSKCSAIQHNSKQVQHRYIAMQQYKPCPVCKPCSYIDDWYFKMMKKR